MVTKSIARLIKTEDKHYKQMNDFKLAGGGGVRISLIEKRET